MKPAVFHLLIALTMAASVPAGLAGDTTPEWGSISASRAHLRVGPGKRFPIEWVFTAPTLPVQITDRHENWREVVAPGGVSGWMHRSLLSGRQTALVTAPTVMRRRAAHESAVRAEVKAGAVVILKDTCQPGWCRVTTGEWEGYISSGALWGPTDPEGNRD